jgi:hypothetical protein
MQLFLTLNIEIRRSSESSISVQQWTQRNSLEDVSIHCCSCNKLNSRNKEHYQVWKVLQGPANFDSINRLSVTGSLLENSSAGGGGGAKETGTVLSVLRLCGKDLSSSKTGASWRPRRTVRKVGWSITWHICYYKFPILVELTQV